MDTDCYIIRVSIPVFYMFYFNVFSTQDISVIKDDGKYWIRLAYSLAKRRTAANIVYIVLSFNKKKATFLANGLKVTSAEQILQVCFPRNSFQ